MKVAAHGLCQWRQGGQVTGSDFNDRCAMAGIAENLDHPAPAHMAVATFLDHALDLLARRQELAKPDFATVWTPCRAASRMLQPHRIRNSQGPIALDPQAT